MSCPFYLQVLPPPAALPQMHSLQEVLWAPGIYGSAPSGAVSGAKEAAMAQATATKAAASACPPPTPTRRGFGLEIETVQHPPDPEATGHFTKLAEYCALVRRLRDASDSANANVPPALWDRLLKWGISHDPQVSSCLSLPSLPPSLPPPFSVFARNAAGACYLPTA